MRFDGGSVPVGDLVEGEPEELSGNEAADLLELVAVEVQPRLDDLVHDHAVGADDDGEDLVLGDQDEVHRPDRKLQQRRHEDEADLIGESGKGERRFVKNVIDLGAVGDLLVDRLTLPLRERPRRHQVVDEEAVAAVGRNAAGRGVRLRQVAEVLEIGHDVAEAGRRELKAAALRQRAGADRFARGNVLHDDLAQDLPRASVELLSLLAHPFRPGTLMKRVPTPMLT